MKVSDMEQAVVVVVIGSVCLLTGWSLCGVLGFPSGRQSQPDTNFIAVEVANRCGKICSTERVDFIMGTAETVVDWGCALDCKEYTLWELSVKGEYK